MEESHVDLHLPTDPDCENSGFHLLRTVLHHKGKGVGICTILMLDPLAERYSRRVIFK
jgi:hypothetical protein